MMIEFNKLIQAQFIKMCATGKLFRSSISGQEVWNLYLNGFGVDEKFRDPQSSVHNCNLCNNFIRRYGNVVAIDENYEIMSLFDVIAPEEYANSAALISKVLKSASIVNVFFETFNELNFLPYESCNRSSSQFKLGVDKNVKRYTKEEAEKFGVVKPNEIYTFNHFHMFLPTQFVDQSGDSIEQVMASFRDSKEVFERGMIEISLDTLKLVKDLINQNSLLDGSAHLFKVDAFIPFKTEYDKLTLNRSNWCWVKSYKLPIARFKNELMGVLCIELSEGKDLNAACQSWNKRVDPVNYMKAKAPYTERQKKEAQKFIEDNGYAASFIRRYATIDDIKVSEVLHSNMGDDSVKSISIFDGLKSPSTRHKRSEFNGIEEVSIEKFMKDILPNCTSVEAFLTNQHDGNMVSMLTSDKKDSKPIFKWDNNYNWTFNGNLTGKSQIRDAVKVVGGNVDGVWRFSIIWNDVDAKDNSDLDAWCRQPDGQLIGYNAGYRKDNGNRFTSFGGQLDVDNTQPSGKLAVENIYFTKRELLKPGTFDFWVNPWSPRNSQGFKAELYIDGETYTYEYRSPVNANVKVASVTLGVDGKVTIKHHLVETDASKQIYCLETNQFHKVNLVCLSPNHWGDNNVGNKHYFFMLEGCKSPESVRSFHAENLISELYDHRRVLEPLGDLLTIPPDLNKNSKQLSGLGFNATVTDELIVKLQGSFKRTVKIKF